MILQKANNSRGNTFLKLLLFFALLGAIGYVVYTNKDFQRTHKQDIKKLNFYFRDYIKSAKDFSKKIDEKIAEWRKSHPSKAKTPAEEPKLETRTFEELLYDQHTLEQEIPLEMVRHQPDEITICSFSADFLLNNSLSDKEMVHLANIFRFCDLSSIAGLQNQKFLTKIIPLLKTLRYSASYESSPITGANKTTYAFIYRNDRITILKPAKMYSQTNSFSTLPYYGVFKANGFDFIVTTFNTPPSGLALASIEPLENFYDTVLNENPEIRDIMIFGDFTFRSEALSWDSASLLPTIAHAATAEKTQPDLVGNFWFKKNDLVEFNGKSGLINIKENLFPSKRKPAVLANKPIWTQFKLMPDDD